MITLIIATRNRAASLESTLASVEKIRVPAGWTLELLVIDKASTAETATMVSAFAQQASTPVRWVWESQVGLSSARNRGVYEARGEILVFTDDDVILTETWLEELITEFEANPGAVVVGRRTLPFTRDLPPQGLKLDAERRQFRWPFGPGEVIGNNMAFRRELFSDVAPFDPSLGAGRFFGAYEETDFIYRALKKRWNWSVYTQSSDLP